MTAKEYLNQLIDMNLRIESLKMVIKICYSKSESTTSNASETASFNTSKNNTSKIEKNVIKAVECKEELENLNAKFIEFAFEATLQINNIENNLLAALLMNRYVCCMTWEQVAEIIDKDVDYTKKELHSKALRDFEKYNPDYPRKTLLLPP